MQLAPDISSKAPPTYDVLGVPISAVCPELVADSIEEWANDDNGRFVCFRDVASLMTISDDQSIKGLHEEAAIIAPDGMPIALLGKLLGYRVKRTSGPDFMDFMMRRSLNSKLKHYLYGGKDDVAIRLKSAFEDRYPGIKIVGCESPPLYSPGNVIDSDTILRIKNSGADIVWIGLSSPKQDVWMWHTYKDLPQTLLGVGAAFDFHAGIVKRAPRWMQSIMLEWFYRLIHEPKRLWKRYLVLAPKFVLRVLYSQIVSLGRS